MERPTISHVYEAIDALYHSPEIHGKEPAGKWLDQFQQSVYAWEIADHLLRENRDNESTYFAAQSMKSKIQYHFAELPIQNHLSLRDSLLDHLYQYSLASHATLTQLCLALADLAIQCPQWKTPVNDLVQKFSTKLEHFSILLEILMIMPEELENDALHIGANRRNEVYELFRHSSSVVFDLMLRCHEIFPTDDKTQCKLYQCFGSWLTIGSFPPKEVAESKLLKLAFETLLSPHINDNLHEAITDCLCNALYTATDIDKQLPLAEACFNFVSTTLPAAFHVAIKNDDLDKSMNYARIFTEMAEAFLEAILTTPGQGPGNLQTLDLVLSCVEHPNYEVAEICFNFWYRFAEHLSSSTELNDRQIFKPYIQKLIAHLCRLCQFETNHEGVPGKGDEFQEFRLRVLDVIHDVVYIPGSSDSFAQMAQSLQEVKQDWNKLEAKLFTSNPMTKFLSRHDEAPAFVLQLVLNLPPNIHIMVRHTCVVLVGDISHWIVDHDQFISPVFQYILNALQNKDLAQMAAYALSKFCRSCCRKMNNTFSVLLEVSKAVESLNIDNDGVIGILTGCAMVLSHMPPDVVTDGLMHLCTPHVQPLYEIVKSTATSDPVLYLDRLACIFRNIHINVTNREHPCKKVIEQLWDLFKMIVEKFKRDDRIMERHFRCIRFGIRCIGQDFMHLLQPLVELMVNLYNEQPHSCLLYIGSVIVDEYGDNKAVEKPLIQMFKSFVNPTFTLLSQDKGLFNHPDTVDDFFRMCIRFLQRCTLSFLKNESIDSVIQLSIAGITLDHREANQSIMKFFVELIKCTYIDQNRAEYNEVRERVSLVEKLLEKYGQNIVQGIVSACAGGIQGYMLPDTADVLWEMIQFCQRPTCMWFKNALSTLPSHNATGSINATPEQIQAFYTTVTSATSIKVLWKEFRDFSKYFK
ncbi:transportin-3-like [Hydractinia symbiolongicarpus]|uniref:transportin-3-like n=1 Tax=Hydractinia symbiolongicarpus TaxID=13093 RepID=UPI0025516EF9|nr:transportin-3-like [Hydractinia symbiolongicarpus]